MSSAMAAASRRAAVTAATLRRAPTPAALARGGAVMAGPGASRGMASHPALTAAYKTVWKSNPMYITYIIGASIVLEFVYGKVGDGIFNSINKGKQYDDIDWSKFAEEEDEDEEEEEEDDE